MEQRSEKEKLSAGELYTVDEQLLAELSACKQKCEKYNRTPRSKTKKRQKIMRSLLGKCGKNFHFESNVWFDYGYNTEIGENFYANHDCVFLDTNKLIFGDNVFVAPQCGFYTAGHPLEADLRIRQLEFAKPIVVGDNVWFGGGVRVLPGVTIGSNVVVGAGSVVTRDIPPNSVAVGDPARVVKTLPPQ